MCSRDCQAWKDDDLALSTTNNETAKLLDDVITQYITWTEFQQNGGIEGTLTKMLEGDPEYALGNAVSIGLDLMGTGRTIRLDNEFAKDVKSLKTLMDTNELTTREKLHCKAVLLFSNDEILQACDTWEEILVQYPNDALALKFAHDAYFYLGNSVMIRDSVGRVLPYWKPSHPYYGYLEGMYAFGLEEMNLYSLAEKYAKHALSVNVTDCWATHAAAHCYEMTGRTSEGIKFMSSTETDWTKGAMLACHNYWHWALYHIERGETDLALGLYDTQVGERVNSGAMLDTVDAASLLKRLEFEGVNVGDRWDSIYEICRPHSDDHITVFNDAHFLLCFLGARESKEDLVKTFETSVQNYIEENKGTNRDICNQVGQPLFDAVIAYSEGRYDDAVEFLHPVKNKIQTIGGSHAQRDVFSLLLIHSCISSKKAKNVVLGKALLHERKLLKENSPMTDRMMSKWLTCHAS